MTAKKSALGRGLGALIEEANEPKHESLVSTTNEIEIELIELNPFQPRKHFDQEALNELASSITELGIIQPITVRKLDNGNYQLITGERRLRAAQIAGLTTLPAYIRTADDQAMLEMALVENIQREDLDAIEIAISYQRLIEECNLTQENLSERVGKKRSTVTNYLRLLKLPAEIQLGIRQRKILMGHARALINIDNPESQVEIFNHIVEDDLSARQVEELVRQMNEPQATIEKLPKATKEKVEEILSKENIDYRDQLRQVFNSKVELQRNIKGAGKIVIPFNSENELLQIISLVEKIQNHK